MTPVETIYLRTISLRNNSNPKFISNRLLERNLNFKKYYTDKYSLIKFNIDQTVLLLHRVYTLMTGVFLFTVDSPVFPYTTFLKHFSNISNDFMSNTDQICPKLILTFI